VVIKSVFETRILAQLPALGRVTTTYVYDYANRLIALGSQGATTTYGYDACLLPGELKDQRPWLFRTSGLAAPFGRLQVCCRNSQSQIRREDRAGGAVLGAVKQADSADAQVF
jgi:hypothetical protein